MGLYINNIGTTFDEKVSSLKENHSAVETTNTFQENLVCVKDNVFFAAAAYCYSQAEFEEFNRQSGRKTWLTVPNVKELAQ